MQLKLGQTFSLACLIQFGPLLTIESTGHLKERVALFRSAEFQWKSPSQQTQPGISGLGGLRLLPLSFCQHYDLDTASGSDVPGAGISGANINKFLGCMAEDHTDAKAADELRKG